MSENVELLAREEKVFNELYESATSNGGKQKALPKGDVQALSNVFELTTEKIKLFKKIKLNILYFKLLALALFSSITFLISIFIIEYPAIYFPFYLIFAANLIGLFALYHINGINRMRVKRHIASCHNLLALLSDQKLLYQFDINTKLVMEEHILDLKHVLGIDK